MKSPRPTDPVQSLYICATPIGNLGDITQRALDTLRSVSLIFAEDTRMTQRLLTHFGIKTPLKSLHKFNEASRINQVLELLQNNQSIALVSDAGTPCICDPGYRIVAAVRDAGFAVTAIPGASALAAFLSVAGISADRFMFTGFVPKRPQDWKA
ncbi:16S rRNA (cytidine(1402)-2'-O)-methyltransferase, partial [bacterium]|nr:16S rRNA (cytidine(1402)-2'-O)-methyltransferase [bacterium]